MDSQKNKILEKYNHRYWITEGMTVVHVTNTSFPYTVNKILKNSKEIICKKTDKGSFQTSSGQYKKRKTFINGIECTFIDSNGKRFLEVFHSRELIPYEIVKNNLINQWYFAEKF